MSRGDFVLIKQELTVYFRNLPKHAEGGLVPTFMEGGSAMDTRMNRRANKGKRFFDLIYYNPAVYFVGFIHFCHFSLKLLRKISYSIYKISDFLLLIIEKISSCLNYKMWGLRQ